MSNDEHDDKKISMNLNSIKMKKLNNSKLRNASNLNTQMDSTLILKDYSTPNPLKSEKSVLEMEMRKTIQSKQVLMKNNNIFNYNDFSSKINNKRSLVNNLKVIQENMSNPFFSNNKINLEPLHLNISRNDYINRMVTNNQENNQKITEDVNRQNTNKLILRPIEIKDINKNLKNKNKQNCTIPNNTVKNDNNNNIENNYNNSLSNNMNLSKYSKLKNKEIYNSNSSSNLLGHNNVNQEKSLLDTKNYITSKNFLNGEIYNNINFKKNIKNFNDMFLKKEKLKDATVPNNTNLNATTLDVNNQSPVCEKKIIDKFSKTSNFEFNIIENLDVINLNTDISLIEENLKMNKGEFIRKLKSLYDDFNNSQRLFRNNNSCIVNNKSNYNNTSMVDRDRNITRIETIFENYEVKLDEMILLNANKSTRKLGTLKKMVHTASLNLYVVRELPIVNKDFKLDLKEMLGKWRRDLNDNSHLINIYGENIDNSEKNYSVIYEYCQYGNLNTLIKNINSFPENLLKMISFQILIALDNYHKKTGNCYNCITPSNILFDTINFENIIKNINNITNINSIHNETQSSLNQKKHKDELKNDCKESFFNESKMRQKLKKDWIQISNKYQSEIDVDFIDNSIDMLQDSKYYLNSSNILPNIEMNNYNTNYEKLPLVNKNENFYQSQLNLNSNYNEKSNFKGNIKNKNLSQVNFIESGKNFFEADKRLNGKTQKLNFNSIYQYNLKSENDLIEKIKNRDRENFLNNNSQNKNINNIINSKYMNFNETAFISNNNNKIKNNTLYLANNNHNLNQNEITYINMNNNNSAGFRFYSSGDNHYINANLANVKLDLYDLGLLIIYCLLGGFDLFNFFDYECKHTRSDNCCCLLHCYYKYESKSKNKIKLSDYFKKFNFSFNLDNFICSLTNYKLEKNLCIDNIKEHLWLSDVRSRYSNNRNKIHEHESHSLNDKVKMDNRFPNFISKNLLIDLGELLRLANDIDNKGSLVNNNMTVKKFEKFFESFENIIPNSSNYFKHNNIMNYSQILNKKKNLDIICKELNIDKEYLDNRIKTIIDNYLLSHEFLNNNENI